VKIDIIWLNFVTKIDVIWIIFVTKTDFFWLIISTKTDIISQGRRIHCLSCWNCHAVSLFHSRPQAVAVYCVPTLAVSTAFQNFDLLQKLCAFGVSGGYVNW